MDTSTEEVDTHGDVIVVSTTLYPEAGVLDRLREHMVAVTYVGHYDDDAGASWCLDRVRFASRRGPELGTAAGL